MWSVIREGDDWKIRMLTGLGVVWFFFYRRRKYKLTAEPKERL
jgi:hypothetical protein